MYQKENYAEVLVSILRSLYLSINSTDYKNGTLLYTPAPQGLLAAKD